MPYNKLEAAIKILAADVAFLLKNQQRMMPDAEKAVSPRNIGEVDGMSGWWNIQSYVGFPAEVTLGEMATAMFSETVYLQGGQAILAEAGSPVSRPVSPSANLVVMDADGEAAIQLSTSGAGTGAASIFAGNDNSGSVGSIRFYFDAGAWAFNTGTGGEQLRVANNGPLSASWAGTVSATTRGHVVEQGGDANGDFIKFADGTMICWGVATASAAAAATWTYPAAFASAPRVTATCVDVNQPRHATVATAGLTSVNFSGWDETGARAAPPVSLVATGRWK